MTMRKTVTHGYYNKDKIMNNTFLILRKIHLITDSKISVILVM